MSTCCNYDRNKADLAIIIVVSAIFLCVDDALCRENRLKVYREKCNQGVIIIEGKRFRWSMPGGAPAIKVPSRTDL